MSPDVQIRNLPDLVDAGAITPTQPASLEDQVLLDRSIERAREAGLLPVP